MTGAVIQESVRDVRGWVKIAVLFKLLLRSVRIYSANDEDALDFDHARDV